MNTEEKKSGKGFSIVKKKKTVITVQMILKSESGGMYKTCGRSLNLGDETNVNHCRTLSKREGRPVPRKSREETQISQILS